MTFAVLSDIHGNLPALEAVLSELPPVDSVICCGDLVGYYCYPNEVCAAVRALNPVCIQGNHDACVTSGLSAGVSAEAYRTAWTREVIEPDHLTWLSELPEEITLCHDGLNLKIRHASPWDTITYLYPDSPHLDRVDAGEDEWLLCGHTHHPLFHLTSRGGRVANPGSVGQPRDYDPRASWAILDTKNRTFEIRRTPYPTAALQRHLESLDWPRGVIEILSRVRS
jgi:putative phosphoesterase